MHRYFDTTITDNYRWMEGEPSADLGAFVAASAAFADSQIARVQGREKLASDIDSLNAPGVTVSDVTPDGDTLFLS